MGFSNDLDQVLDYFRKAFPSLTERQDIARQSHEDWIALRTKLQLLIPKDVVVKLPFVLVDLAQTAATSRFEDGDMVIYFLDVLANSAELDNPAMRALVEKYAEEEIGGEEGEHFKLIMTSKLPEVGNLSEDDRRARDLRDREASFAELTAQQQEAVYRWLQYINEFDELEQRETELLRANSREESFEKPLQFDHCRDALRSATAYWYLRSHPGNFKAVRSH